MSFYYQDMDVYYIALGFVDSVLDMTKRMGPVLDDLLRKLEKMAIDIPISIAKMTGEYNRRIPSAAFLEIRSQVFACQALLELLWRRKLIKEKDADELGDTLIVLSKMLTDLLSESSDTSRRMSPYRPDRPIFD